MKYTGLLLILTSGALWAMDEAKVKQEASQGVKRERSDGGEAAHSEKRTKHLHDAMKEGDVELAKSLLEQGADVSGRNSLGETPLMAVVVQDEISLLRLIDWEGKGAQPPQKGQIQAAAAQAVANNLKMQQVAAVKALANATKEKFSELLFDDVRSDIDGTATAFELAAWHGRIDMLNAFKDILGADKLKNALLNRRQVLQGVMMAANQPGRPSHLNDALVDFVHDVLGPQDFKEIWPMDVELDRRNNFLFRALLEGQAGVIRKLHDFLGRDEFVKRAILPDPEHGQTALFSAFALANPEDEVGASLKTFLEVLGVDVAFELAKVQEPKRGNTVLHETIGFGTPQMYVKLATILKEFLGEQRFKELLSIQNKDELTPYQVAQKQHKRYAMEGWDEAFNVLKSEQ